LHGSGCSVGFDALLELVPSYFAVHAQCPSLTTTEITP
jgi:hypothetical protein